MNPNIVKLIVNDNEVTDETHAKANGFIVNYIYEKLKHVNSVDQAESILGSLLYALYSSGVAKKTKIDYTIETVNNRFLWFLKKRRAVVYVHGCHETPSLRLSADCTNDLSVNVRLGLQYNILSRYSFSISADSELNGFQKLSYSLKVQPLSLSDDQLKSYSFVSTYGKKIRPLNSQVDVCCNSLTTLLYDKFDISLIQVTDDALVSSKFHDKYYISSTMRFYKTLKYRFNDYALYGKLSLSPFISLPLSCIRSYSYGMTFDIRNELTYRKLFMNSVLSSGILKYSVVDDGCKTLIFTSNQCNSFHYPAIRGFTECADKCVIDDDKQFVSVSLCAGLRDCSDILNCVSRTAHANSVKICTHLRVFGFFDSMIDSAFKSNMSAGVALSYRVSSSLAAECGYAKQIVNGYNVLTDRFYVSMKLL